MKYADRICALVECDIVVHPHRRDEKYCCKLHGGRQNSRDYRAKNRRVPVNKEVFLNTKDNHPRGGRASWKKYMVENPIYFYSVFEKQLTKTSLEEASKSLFGK